MNSVAIGLEMNLMIDYGLSLTITATLSAAVVGSLLEAIRINDSASRPVPRGM